MGRLVSIGLTPSVMAAERLKGRLLYDEERSDPLLLRGFGEFLGFVRRASKVGINYVSPWGGERNVPGVQRSRQSSLARGFRCVFNGSFENYTPFSRQTDRSYLDV